MKILFVCHRLPFPPKRGGKIRPFNIIRHLHDLGHEVTVASLARSAEEFDEGLGLQDFCTETLIERVSRIGPFLRMLIRLPTLTPSSMGYFYSPRLARRISDAHKQKNFDLVFVHCSSVAGYVTDLPGPTKIFDLGDIDSQKWLLYSRFRKFPLSLGYWLEGIKLERTEKKLAKQFDLCTCTTRAELKTFDEFSTGVASGWFPNGVDTQYFSVATEPYDPDLICFVGRMDYYPNQEAMLNFCQTVWPTIRQQRPATKLCIVGADPSPEMYRLGKLPGVEVTGSVPDVRPYVQKAVLTVAPLSIARGTQNKILESMAMGVPVVSSEEAAPGVDAAEGESLLVAGAPQEYSDAILRLLNDPEERNRISAAGRQRVLACHSWEASMQKLDGLIATCLSQTQHRKSGRVVESD